MDGSVREWAESQFELADGEARRAFAAKIAEHSKNGTLSSRSVYALADLYMISGDAALTACLEGLSQSEGGRGRAWKAEIREIRAAALAYIDRGPKLIAEKLGARVPSSLLVAERHFAVERAKVSKQIDNYQHGWTAPPGKSLRERYAIPFAVAAFVFGVLCDKAADRISMHLFPDPPASVCAGPP